MAPKFGLSPDLEARFGRVPLDCEQTGASYERRAPNFRTPFGHSHRDQEEVYVVIGGGGRVKIGDDIKDVKLHDLIRVAPAAVRCFEAGPAGVELLAFGARATGENDAEMIADWWTD